MSIGDTLLNCLTGAKIKRSAELLTANGISQYDWIDSKDTDPDVCVVFGYDISPDIKVSFYLTTEEGPNQGEIELATVVGRDNSDCYFGCFTAGDKLLVDTEHSGIRALMPELHRNEALVLAHLRFVEKRSDQFTKPFAASKSVLNASRHGRYLNAAV